mgnify:CR=1 FL=1
MLENQFKTNLVGELKKRFPGCIVLHIDPNEIQGIPDLLILYRDRWAALSVLQQHPIGQIRITM